MNIPHDEYIEMEVDGIHTLATDYAITFSSEGASVTIPRDVFMQKLVVLVRAELLTSAGLAEADEKTTIKFERANEHFH